MAATKKTLYHSELVGLGVVTVRVASDVMPSKYSKPGAEKPPWVALIINGSERTYTTENDVCAAFFEGLKGKQVTIEAQGSRDDAVIEYAGVPKPPGDQPPRFSPEPSSEIPFPPQKPAEPPVHDAVEAKKIIGRAGNLWGLCAKALSHQLNILNKSTATAWIALAFAEDAQATQSAVATILIEAQRNGAGLNLPCGDSAHSTGGAK